MTQPDTAAVGMHDDDMVADPALRTDYHTADTSGSGGTSDAVDSQAAQDPDLVLVAGEVIDDNADPGTTDTGDLDDEDLAGDNLAEGDQEWHDIQALFVDDPRGSVELAAAAADAAVTALVESLRQRQSALGQAGSTSADPGGTEQLREALRSYRFFCQSLTDIGQRLAQPTAMAG
jgi:hypothetical protein